MKTSKAKKTTLHISLTILTLVIGITLGLLQVKSPRVNEASDTYPAYQRMLANIQKLATEPHPSGSAEIEVVRTQLLAEIEDMGLAYTVEDASYTALELADIQVQLSGASSIDEWWEWNKEWIAKEYDIHSIEEMLATLVGEDGTLNLQNILVKLDAPDTDSGVMFVSHYDSTSGGPGAADDMVAVCAMLEALREQTTNSTLKNDIYFLFTDGEENYLLGANKFVKAHPELKDKIDMVINFEARGNSGGVLLFETSPKAYQLIETTIKSGAKPIGMSWAAAIYAMMPNNTDLTHFLNAGYNGINFAAIEGVETYHQPTDTYENLNKSTAWQYLHTTLALASYAANSDLSELQKAPSEAVYFPFLPGFMVLMSGVVSHIFCANACILALLFTVVQARRKKLKLSPSVVLITLLVILSIGSAFLFAAGSYLFYIPLLAIVITAFLRDLPVANITARVLSGIIALLLWVPVVFLLWVSMIQPMML